jgi:hypothetical protein
MPFDLKQTTDTKQSVLFDYPQMTVTSVTLNDGDFLQGNYIGGGSSPNIVYTKSNVKSNFNSTQLRIYGVLFPKLVESIKHTGTLVIKNVGTTNSPPNVYMCFLLNTFKISVPSDIDKLISSDGNTNPSFYLNNVVKPASGTNQYISYAGKDKNSNDITVIIYTSPIPVVTQPFSETTSDWISVTEPPNYSIVDSAEAAGGEWMECDYAAIDSDEVVTTYNIPIQSSLIKDSNSLDSFRTLIMFMVFLILCVFSYLIIPSIYLAVMTKLIAAVGGNNISTGEKKTWILYLDIALSTVFGLTGLILICIGAFGNSDPSLPDYIANTSDILLAGFSISIIFIISYIVVQSKKMTGKFIEGVKYELV